MYTKRDYHFDRIFFCSIRHCKSKFCQYDSLLLYTLTLCDYQNFRCCKNKNFKKQILFEFSIDFLIQSFCNV